MCQLLRKTEFFVCFFLPFCIIDILTFFKQIFAILRYSTDDSGRWGSGGLFTALSRRSALPKEQYELAGKMKGKYSRRVKRDLFYHYLFCFLHCEHSISNFNLIIR